MKLLVVSHKRCFGRGDHGFATDGGFPAQIDALSELAADLRLVVYRGVGAGPEQATWLTGRGVSVLALPEPGGRGIARKLRLPWWLVRHGRALWREIGAADVVHPLVPGDLGALGLVGAFLRRKPLLVRFCGTWGTKDTFANRLLAAWLPRLAGAHRPVLATGLAESPPAPGNPHVHWIFSTTLRERDLRRLPRARVWKPGQPLRLCHLGRQTAGKNARAVLEALPRLARDFPEVSLDVIGDGPELPVLERRARELGIAERLRCHGLVPNTRVPSLLAECSVLVLPTRVAEGFPKAVLEAMVCGLPVLAPPVGAIPVLLGDPRLLLDATDASAVEVGLRRLLHDSAQLSDQCARLRRRASTFTLERWRDQFAVHLAGVAPPTAAAHGSPREVLS